MPIEYQNRARTSPTFYLILVVGVVFVIASLAINPAENCVAYPCPLWLRLLAGLLGALFTGGALFALIQDYRSGSRIEPETGQLVWWEGVPPLSEQQIPAQEIRTIVIDPDADGRSVVLLDEQGTPLPLPDACIPSSYRTWVKSLQQAFPHIAVREV